MAAGSELNEQIGKAYHAFMADGTVAALGRDAIKDVRNMFMEVFFGKGERGSEPGMPLNPLFHDIVQARKSHGQEHGAGPSSPLEKGPTMSSMNTNQAMPTPSQVIANPQAYLSPQQGQGNGNAMAMEAAAPDRGKDAVQSNAAMTPTPSQVIANPSAYLSEQQQQPGHEQEHGNGR